MICRADTIGVFQIESRAQMATLPRLRPRTFYDLVVEIALIRPGPIQGGSVHPYIRRRNGQEPVTYLHPLLERSLAKTLGIPLFQEQLMQMAIDVAGFSPGEADQLRQAMGSKRSTERMERLRARFAAGTAERGITEDVTTQLWDKLAAFANYGFPESHSVSFAYLVYSSSWIKFHYPAAFCAALLNAQPMGFYSPQSLTADARRHGVRVLGPNVCVSLADASLERPGHAVRLGLSSVRAVSAELAERIEKSRTTDGPFADLTDLVRRCQPSQPALEALATAGALDELISPRPSGSTHNTGTEGARACLSAAGVAVVTGTFGNKAANPTPHQTSQTPHQARPDPTARRRALWAAGALAHTGPDRLAGVVVGVEAPALPGLTPTEEMAADLWATGVTPDGHPLQLVRPYLNTLGVVTAEGLRSIEHGTRVKVGGVVTHRQRPASEPA